MRLLECVLPPDANIYKLSDDHEGALAQHTDGLHEAIQTIEQDSIGYWCHLGDWLETLMVDHPYYDPRVLAKDEEGIPSVPMKQAENQANRYMPIKDKLLAGLLGNHEQRALKYGNLVQYLLGLMGRPETYGGYSCKLSIKDAKGKTRLKLFLHHGRNIAESRAGTERQRQANREAQLMRILHPLAGDCQVMSMAHTHRLIVVEPMNRLYLVDDGLKIKQKYIKSASGDYIDPENRWYVNTGSFYRSQMIGMDSYPEKAMYPPTELGYPVIEMRDYQIANVRKVII